MILGHEVAQGREMRVAQEKRSYGKPKGVGVESAEGKCPRAAASHCRWAVSNPGCRREGRINSPWFMELHTLT